jgi:hypothetical protein
MNLFWGARYAILRVALMIWASLLSVHYNAWTTGCVNVILISIRISIRRRLPNGVFGIRRSGPPCFEWLACSLFCSQC